MKLTVLLIDFFGVLTDWGSDLTLTEPPLVSVLRQARSYDLHTGLVSNASGPVASLRESLPELFDITLFSGQLGIAKPDPRIFLAAAEKLGVSPQSCVYVDDMAVNVRAAANVGMVGVQHISVESTVDELSILFGLKFGNF